MKQKTLVDYSQVVTFCFYGVLSPGCVILVFFYFHLFIKIK